MQSAEDIINSFGGYAQLAAALGCPAGTVSAWKSRGSIPADYWASIIKAADDRGVEGLTFELLARLAAERRRPAPTSEEAA